MEALQGNLHKFIYTLQDAGGGFQVSLKDGMTTQRWTAGRFLKSSSNLRLEAGEEGDWTDSPSESLFAPQLDSQVFFFFSLMNQKTPLWTQHKENSKSPQQRSF